MGREVISGEDFYDTVVDMGEEIEFLTDPVIKQYASITAYRATGTTNMTDGAYQYRGVMTFDNVEQQNELLGEYFKRQTNKVPVYMLTSTLPENTTPLIATCYCVECNDKIDIITHYEKGKPDEFGVQEMIPVYLAKDVDCYITVTQRQLAEAQAGSIVSTVTNILLPAHYLLSQNNIVVKKVPVYDDSINQNVLKDVEYRVDSIDTSLLDVIQKEIIETNEDGEEITKMVDKIVGVMRCFLTEAI